MCRQQKSIVIATDRAFWLDDRGDRRRIAALCRYLVSLDLSVHVFYVQEENQPQPEAGLCNDWGLASVQVASRCGCRAGAAMLGFWRRYLARSATVLCSGPEGRSWREPTLQSFRDPWVRRDFRRMCGQIKPHCIIIEYIKLAYLVQGLKSCRMRVLSLLDTHDVISARTRSFHAAGEPHGISVTEQEEVKALEACDEIMAIQDRDAERLRRLVPDRPVFTAGHACPVEPLPPPPSHPFTILFLAAQGAPNRRAIRQFLEVSWGRLRDRFGAGIELVIAGHICAKIHQEDVGAGVRLLGYVSDLRDAYRLAHLVINPVAFGGGLKIKNVEALCHGMPLVTTTVGVEGMEEGIGTAFLVCDDSDTLVHTISELVSDPSRCAALRGKAVAFAQTHFTEDAAYRELRGVLSKHGVI